MLFSYTSAPRRQVLQIPLFGLGYLGFQASDLIKGGGLLNPYYQR
jgi:hypothetical protein